MVLDNTKEIIQKLKYHFFLIFSLQTNNILWVVQTNAIFTWITHRNCVPHQTSFHENMGMITIYSLVLGDAYICQ